jgi:hypothetical protein
MTFDAMNSEATRILVRDRQRAIHEQATNSRHPGHPSALRVRTGSVLVRAGRRLSGERH